MELLRNFSNKERREISSVLFGLFIIAFVWINTTVTYRISDNSETLEQLTTITLMPLSPANTVLLAALGLAWLVIWLPWLLRRGA